MQETADGENVIVAEVYETRVETEVLDADREQVEFQATWSTVGDSVTYGVPGGVVTLQLQVPIDPDGIVNATEYIFSNVQAALIVPLDNPGCDGGYPNTVCNTKCCANHDRCYEKYNCTQSSWVNNSDTCSQDCGRCNSAAVSCMNFNPFSGCSCGTSLCGCNDYECYDDDQNATYCRDRCLASGALPAGVAPGTRGTSREGRCYAQCGDGTCEANEPCSCQDCTNDPRCTPHVCGDGWCDPMQGETANNCCVDCCLVPP